MYADLSFRSSFFGTGERTEYVAINYKDSGSIPNINRQCCHKNRILLAFFIWIFSSVCIVLRLFTQARATIVPLYGVRQSLESGRPAFPRAQPSGQKEGGPALFVDNIWTTPLSSKLISIHQPFSSIRLRPALFVP